MEYIDLRSDTVTLPTPAMREAMAKAAVGDDVYGEDPTVNKLQEMGAEVMGKEAGLFVPSGTMGNLVALLAHCGRGDEVILGNKAHTFLYEAGGISALGGIHSCQIPNQPDGTLALEDIRHAIRPDELHNPPTRLVALENTHNRCGGVALTVAYTRLVGELAKEQGLAMHMDGARIFNAAVSLGVNARELAQPADSITFCISKALCAPVGSILCGSRQFIDRARRMRKQLGGGMRQAGILAAAGIVALDTMIDRLAEDHLHAKWLGRELSQIPGLELDPGSPYTNMIFCSLSTLIKKDAHQVAEELSRMGVQVGIVGRRSFRIVLHYWIDDAALSSTVDAFSKTLGSMS